MRGEPHDHNLIWTSEPGISSDAVGSSDVTLLKPLFDLVNTTSTSLLLPRGQDDISELHNVALSDETKVMYLEKEKEYEYNVEKTLYFKDECHPNKERFNSDGYDDYTYRACDGSFTDVVMREKMRRWQLANQMHTCCTSCWKYNKDNESVPKERRRCRYNFMRPLVAGNELCATIVTESDNRGRKRMRVAAPRNNGFINAHTMSPLLCLASRGNQDLSYVDNGNGTPEYASKYSSKADQPDSKELVNAIARTLSSVALRSNDPSRGEQEKLSATINAFIGAQQIGAVHAAAFLLGNKFVKTPRTVVTVNTLHSIDVKSIILDPLLLNDLESSETSAYNESPASTNGRRDAYHQLCIQYHKQTLAAAAIAASSGETAPVEDTTLDRLTFFAFLTVYSVKYRPADSKPFGPNSKILINECPPMRTDADGFIIAPKTFVLGTTYYSVMRTKAIVRLTPNIPVNEEEERSAFSTLLLYSSWGLHGVPSILLDDDGNAISAVDKLKLIKATLPEYVTRSLARVLHSQQMLDGTGRVDENVTLDFDELIDSNNNDLEGDDMDQNTRHEQSHSTQQYEGITSEKMDNIDNLASFTMYGTTLQHMKGMSEFVNEQKTLMHQNNEK